MAPPSRASDLCRASARAAGPTQKGKSGAEGNRWPEISPAVHRPWTSSAWAPSRPPWDDPTSLRPRAVPKMLTPRHQGAIESPRPTPVDDAMPLPQTSASRGALAEAAFGLRATGPLNRWSVDAARFTARVRARRRRRHKRPCSGTLPLCLAAMPSRRSMSSADSARGASTVAEVSCSTSSTRRPGAAAGAATWRSSWPSRASHSFMQQTYWGHASAPERAHGALLLPSLVLVIVPPPPAPAPAPAPPVPAHCVANATTGAGPSKLCKEKGERK